MSFAELKDPVKDELKRFGLFAKIGEESFYPTIEAAVRSFTQKHAAKRNADRSTNPKDGRSR